MAAVAAGALTVATAVPAMAFENEFHGMFRVFGTISNFLDGAPGQYNIEQAGPVTGTSPADHNAFIGIAPITPKAQAPTRTFMEQRARLMYIAKANDDLKLVTHFEIDSRWGDSSYGVARNNGGALGADEVNLETKSVYLDFNLPTKTPINFKVGMQPFTDAYKGLFVNADMAGAIASAKYGSAATALGFFRLDDRGSVVGKNARDLVVLDGKFNVTKNVKVGASYYLLNDDSSATITPSVIKFINPTNSIVHTLGANAEAVVGPATLDAFVMYQFGNNESYTWTGQGTVSAGHLNAWAAQASGKVNVGPGTARALFLYATGDAGKFNRNGGGNSTAFQTVNNQTSSAFAENSFFAANMFLLLPNATTITGNKAIIYSAGNNLNQGMISGFIGYDAKITDKLFANVNAGFAAAAQQNADVKPVNQNTGNFNNSDYLGTEVNLEVGYKLFENMTASIQSAYVVLGDYYKGTMRDGADPRDPYMSRIMLNYAF
jgi:hypothetical protein